MANSECGAARAASLFAKAGEASASVSRVEGGDAEFGMGDSEIGIDGSALHDSGHG